MTDREILKDRIAGAIAGMVLGDALGVPGELWPREKVRGRYGWIWSKCYTFGTAVWSGTCFLTIHHI